MFKSGDNYRRRYAFALLTTMLAVLVSLFLHRVLGNSRTLLFFTAVVLSALYGGLGPSLLTTILSIIFLTYFLPPEVLLTVSGESLIALSLFASVATGVSLLYEQRRRALNGIFAQQETMRVTLTSIGDAVIATDSEARVTFMNPIAEQLTGWSLADAQGQPIQTIFNIVNETSRQTVDNPVFKVITQGVTVGLANHTILIARDDTEYAIDDSAAPIRDGRGQIVGVVLTFHDITERRMIERTQKLLLQASDLSFWRSDKEYAQSLSELGTLLVSAFADWCEIWLIEQGQPVRKLITHKDHGQQALLEDFYSNLPGSWNMLAQTVHTQKTQQAIIKLDHLITVEANPQIVEQLRTLNPTSNVFVPVQFRDRLLGVVGYHRAGKRPPFSKLEVDFAEELASRMAMTLDNIRLFNDMNESRQRAEQVANRLARTQAITSALNRTQLPSEAARTIVEQSKLAIAGVYGGMAVMLDDSGAALETIYQAGYDSIAQIDAMTRIPMDSEHPTAIIVGEGTPLFLRSNDEWLARFPEQQPWRVTVSLAALPLTIENKSIGCLMISFDQPQQFPALDRAFLLNIAEKCAQAMYRAQLFAAEKALHERLNAIMESVSDGFFGFDRELRYTYINSKGRELIGRPAETLIGHYIGDIFRNGEVDVFLKHAAEALASNKRVDYELLSPVTGTWIASRLYPHQGGLSVFSQDISRRKQAEAQAELLTAQLKAFVESGVIGILFATTAGRITDANDTFLNMIGYSRAEMESGHLSWIDITPPEYAEQDQKAIETSQNSGKPQPAEKEYIHKDGHRVPVLLGGVPVQDSWVSFALDLTERKRAENRLRVLTETSTVLARSLDYRTALIQVAESVVPLVADWCTIHLKDADGTVQQVALTHKDPSKMQWAYQIQREYPEDPNATSGIYQVIRSAEPLMMSSITEDILVAAAKGDEKLLALLHEIGYSALIIVPLIVQGRVLGALQMVSAESRQQYNQDDLALAQDIARRVAVAIDNAQLYAQVHEERERLRVTLSSIGDAVIVTDVQGRVTFTNQVAETLMGLPQAAIIGKPFNDIFNIINDDTHEKAESPLDVVLRDRQITNLTDHTVLISADGRQIPIDDSGAPIFDANGKLIGAILVFRDIRARREAETQLAITFQRTTDLYNISRQIGIASKASDVLAALLNSYYLQHTCQAAILVFDRPWQDTAAADTFEVVASLNDEFPPGFASNHTIGDSPLCQVFTPGRSLFIADVGADDLLEPSLRQLLIESEIGSLIMQPLWSGNVCFGLLALYCAMPHRWSNDDFEHIRIFTDEVAIVMDNVRLFEAERLARQEAEAANQIKIKFLAMISHELRTPLTSIKGFTSSLLALDVNWDAASEREFINIIDEEADKLTELISQLLDLSQLQAGTMRIRPVLQSMQTILNSSMMQLNMMAVRHHLTIEVPDALPMVLADPQRISQVLTNLVGNAVKYAPEGTDIQVTTTIGQDMLQITVSDEGPGIPTEKRQIVFEAFQQLERKSHQPLKGAGLGLAICKALIEAHGGRIWIADTETGTHISFTLPIVPDTQADPHLVADL